MVSDSSIFQQHALKHHLYLMLYLPQHAQRDCVLVRNEAGFWRRAAAPERLHVTIGKCGQFDALPFDLVDQIFSTLSVEMFTAFYMIMDQIIGARHGGLLKPSETLPKFRTMQARLADLLKSAIADYGFNTMHWRRGIAPHVSLNHSAQASPSRPIDPITWQTERISLVDSRYGEGVHDVLGSWPLTASNKR